MALGTMSTLALDRQIRPIYDALDGGLNKSAITVCNKLLKKHPKSDLIKALKALALFRSQKVEESLVLCDEILALKPTNDGVLTAMMHVLRGLGRHSDMVTMFEEAYKQQPTNEELGAQTVFAYIRAGLWKMAQQITARMYKLYREDRYLYWSAMSAVLQADDTTTQPAMRDVLYQLAKRLIASSATPSFKTADRFHLHLTILLKLQLLEEAHALLDNDIGKAICATSLSCNEIRRHVWRMRGLTSVERQRAKELIVEKHERNWLEFISLLDATFQYSVARSNGSLDDKTKQKCVDNIQETQELLYRLVEEDGTKDRSCLLALLELEKRARNIGLSTNLTRIVTLLQQYFEQIGDKACCFEDLKPYVDLPPDEAMMWSKFLFRIPSTFTTIKDLYRNINSCKLHRYSLTSSEITLETESKAVAHYLRSYMGALVLGADLPITELQPADDLALLAGNGYINLWTLSKKESYLICAAVLLEYALTKSKHSFVARLMLVRIYRLLGAPSSSLQLYRAMHVKQVQHDTLSHFVLSRASTFSTAASSDLTFSTECIESTQVYLSNSQETCDFIVRAFTAEKYSQIPEFVAFEERLDNSLQRDLIKMEHLRMRLSHEVIGPDLIDMELIELKFIADRTHHDNRDFDILANYQPLCCNTLNEQTLLFNKAEGHGWLAIFLKMYIRAFQQGSDLDDIVEEKLLIGDRPKQSMNVNRQSLRDHLCDKTEAELSELTVDEICLVDFTGALAEWLEPYHNFARPPPSVVLAEAAKQTQLRTGHPLKIVDPSSLSTTGQSNSTKVDEPPIVTGPPEAVTDYFNSVRKRFDSIKSQGTIVDLLHVATLAQEAYLLFNVESMRFKSAPVIKINKFGSLIPILKKIRESAITVLRGIADELIMMGEQKVAAENRRRLIEIYNGGSLTSEISEDFVFGIVKRLTDSQRKILEGVGKGIMKICDNYPL